MGRGNFSFLILVVGIIQLIAMVWNGRKGRRDSGSRGSRDTDRGSDTRKTDRDTHAQNLPQVGAERGDI